MFRPFGLNENLPRRVVKNYDLFLWMLLFGLLERHAVHLCHPQPSEPPGQSHHRLFFSRLTIVCLVDVGNELTPPRESIESQIIPRATVSQFLCSRNGRT